MDREEANKLVNEANLSKGKKSNYLSSKIRQALLDRYLTYNSNTNKVAVNPLWGESIIKALEIKE